jgi:hypothetical protein
MYTPFQFASRDCSLIIINAFQFSVSAIPDTDTYKISLYFYLPDITPVPGWGYAEAASGSPIQIKRPPQEFIVQLVEDVGHKGIYL